LDAQAWASLICRSSSVSFVNQVIDVNPVRINKISLVSLPKGLDPWIGKVQDSKHRSKSLLVNGSSFELELGDVTMSKSQKNISAKPELFEF
jgi:hypothetical protein